MVVGRLESLGPLRPGTDRTRVVDLVWVYNDPAHYRALVQECGWEEAAFRQWLTSQMAHAILPVAQQVG